VFGFAEDAGETMLLPKVFPEDEAIPKLCTKQTLTRVDSAPQSVATLKDFRDQFLQYFCEGLLREIDWSNIIVAGGSVVGCCQKIPSKYSSMFQRRKYLHDELFSGSDIDLFIWGLNEEQANKKLVEIYEAISVCCPFEVICFRSAYAVTMVSKYPYRHVQVVLRLYSSPYEGKVVCVHALFVHI
jgi:hypothetical protein